MIKNPIENGPSGLTPEALVIESMFHIQNKTGARVDFKLNPSQRAYDQVRTQRDIIAKARQKGFSSLGIAYQTVKCLGREGTRAVLISHEAKATQRLLDKARFYIHHIKGPQAELGRHSRNEFYFPRTESTFYIGTAGARAFGRGDTITHLHISEYAWWESDALKQVAGLFQAVPKEGTICIESTGNGRTNDFYYMVQNAEKLGYNIFFRAWWQDDEYQMHITREWSPEGYENYFQDMKHAYKLTDEQLFWYWIKLLEFRGDLNTMQQEYPSSLEECFKATGGAMFPDASRTKTYSWTWGIKQDRRVQYLDTHPMPNRTYVIGADPSGGTGNDNSAMQIFCLETYEQVLELAHSNIDPVDFGHLLAALGQEYNDAFIVCEANHHGIATHSVLLKIYPRTKIYKRSLPLKAGKPLYGFMTTNNTKARLIGAIKECEELGLTVYGKQTIDELRTFEETAEGKMYGPKDDLVLALGLCCIGLLHYQRYTKIDKVQKVQRDLRNTDEWNKDFMYFTFDEVFKGLMDRTKTNDVFKRQLVN